MYGGNKVRKLEFLLGQAIREGRRAVVTFGAYGSNHALATAVHALAHGLEPHVILSPQAAGPFAARTLRAHAGLGTVIHLADGWDGTRQAAEVVREIVRRDGLGPFVIPGGGTNCVGTIGYVNAAFEFLRQAEEDVDHVKPAVEVVYLAGGTLGSAIGLAIGFAVSARADGGRPIRVQAVRVTPPELGGVDQATRLVDETVALLRSHDGSFPEVSYGDLAFELRDEFYEPGYGVPTPETRAAVEAGAVSGLRLETTYTGKALVAIASDLRTGRLPEGASRALFWDTYNSAPYPEPGSDAVLPPLLREYVAECDALFGSSPDGSPVPKEGDTE
jgi:D-cysteine desulfhydrase